MMKKLKENMEEIDLFIIDIQIIYLCIDNRYIDIFIIDIQITFLKKKKRLREYRKIHRDSKKPTKVLI